MAKKKASSENASQDASNETQAAQNDDFRHIVRVANTDLTGEKPLYIALQKIRGVGENFARVICKKTGYDLMTKTGYLSEDESSGIEKVVHNPADHGIPVWMFNSRREYESGNDLHLLHSDLDFKQGTDIKRKKKIKSNAGLRHQWKLPLRGQRTRSHFRPNLGKGAAAKKRSTVRK